MPRKDFTSFTEPFYKHEQLVKPDGIRVIQLLPSQNFEAELQCELISTSLTECDADFLKQYVALSYVWGDSKDTRLIRVHGRPLAVTATLESALRHLRLKDLSLTIWADAICINQSDDAEKSWQVQLMGKIYEIAGHTVIYLGPSDPASVTTFDIIRKHQAVMKQNLSHQLSFPNGFMISNTSPFLRTWFTRVWIFQELILSKDSWVQCGHSRLRWNAFCLALVSDIPPSIIVHDAEHVVQKHQNLVQQMEGARRRHHDSSSRDTNTLLQLVRSRRGLGVFDPRDMIYAHLGLVDTGGAIIVSYDKSYAQVYEEAANYMYIAVGGSKQYEMFSDVEEIDPDLRREGLPSWVPDWTSHKSDAKNELSRLYKLEYSDPAFAVTFGRLSHTLFQEQVSWRKFWDKFYGIQDVVWLESVHAVASWGASIGAVTATSPKIDHKSEIDGEWTLATILSGEEHDIWDTYFRHADIPIWVIKLLPVDGRRFAKLDTGYICLVPASTRLGDMVGLLWDSELPFVLRPIHPLEADTEIAGLVRDKLMTKSPASQQVTDSSETGAQLRPLKLHHCKYVGACLTEGLIHRIRDPKQGIGSRYGKGDEAKVVYVIH